MQTFKAIPTEQMPLAAAAYAAARAEIVERLKIREDLIKSYIVATLAFAGVSLGYASKPDFFFVAFVMPIVSLPVAIAVRQHKEAVETLARFLRDACEGLAVPTWDVFTRSTATAEKSKSFWTLIGSLFGIHFLTLFSVAVLVGHAMIRQKAGEGYWWLASIPGLSAVAAIVVTLTSHSSRKQNLADALKASQSPVAAAREAPPAPAEPQSK